ncbi:unnamed protein product [Meloidogyne enterolobii]|uniref:Uncharacterized protein n=1 Tax=Meloidogyne enterolobii TaxID=390850 RepID=A0ACB0YNZ0_MELEN
MEENLNNLKINLNEIEKEEEENNELLERAVNNREKLEKVFSDSTNKTKLAEIFKEKIVDEQEKLLNDLLNKLSKILNIKFK